MQVVDFEKFIPGHVVIFGHLIPGQGAVSDFPAAPPVSRQSTSLWGGGVPGTKIVKTFKDLSSDYIFPFIP